VKRFLKIKCKIFSFYCGFNPNLKVSKIFKTHTIKNMLFLKAKDIKHRENFKQIEKLTKIKKFIFINFLNNNFIKDLKKRNLFLNLIAKKLKQTSKSKSKIVRRCIFNNRGRAVFRPYNISRVYLRELMQFGIIPGVKKAVW